MTQTRKLARDATASRQQRIWSYRYRYSICVLHRKKARCFLQQRPPGGKSMAKTAAAISRSTQKAESEAGDHTFFLHDGKSTTIFEGIEALGSSSPWGQSPTSRGTCTISSGARPQFHGKLVQPPQQELLQGGCDRLNARISCIKSRQTECWGVRRCCWLL